LSAHAAVFHDQFVQALGGASTAYAAAEAANASPGGVAGDTGATCLFARHGHQVHTRRRRGPLAQWPAVLPISSTVLPFQWNRTSVVKPLMAPG
jgi:hypothetical protein